MLNYDRKTLYKFSQVIKPFADSSTEPPKGSDNDRRSGSMSEDGSGDLSPSISFSEGRRRIKDKKRHWFVKTVTKLVSASSL